MHCSCTLYNASGSACSHCNHYGELQMANSHCLPRKTSGERTACPSDICSALTSPANIYNAILNCIVNALHINHLLYHLLCHVQCTYEVVAMQCTSCCATYYNAISRCYCQCATAASASSQILPSSIIAITMMHCRWPRKTSGETTTCPYAMCNAHRAPWQCNIRIALLMHSTTFSTTYQPLLPNTTNV